MPNKVFIYSGRGHFPESSADLKMLFENGTIFDHVDVRFSDFTDNFDGLNAATDNLTLVFPGGNAHQMYFGIKTHTSKLSGLLVSGWNYVGVCAGGYLAAQQTELFKTAYELNDAAYHNGFSPPILIGKLPSLAVCQDYDALGPFYPNTTEYLLRIYSGELAPIQEDMGSTNICKPYCVNLNLHNQQKLPALYVDGCAFERRVGTINQHSVFASYPDRYSFLSREKAAYKSFDSMPAVIHRKATRNHDQIQGGVVASGIHFESYVENSRVLNLFANPPTPPNKKCGSFALSQGSLKQLRAARIEAESHFSHLLRQTLTPTQS